VQFWSWSWRLPISRFAWAMFMFLLNVLSFLSWYTWPVCPCASQNIVSVSKIVIPKMLHSLCLKVYTVPFLEFSATSLVFPCKKKEVTGLLIPPLYKHLKLLILLSYILYKGNSNVKIVKNVSNTINLSRLLNAFLYSRLVPLCSTKYSIFV
jgi:hypothetical protein